MNGSGRPGDGGARATPSWLEGAWVRAGRSIDDGPPDECSDVVWLQVGPWFADLRLPRPGRAPAHPFDEAHAFSGRLAVIDVEASGAQVAWHHDLDTADDHDAEPDQATVRLRDHVLVESGDGYVEWWSGPKGGPDGSAPVGPAHGHGDGFVLEHGGGPAGPGFARVVCVGGMAVAVWAGPVRGGAWCSADGGWEPARVVGVVPAGLDIGAALRAWVDGGTATDVWREQGER